MTQGVPNALSSPCDHSVCSENHDALVFSCGHSLSLLFARSTSKVYASYEAAKTLKCSGSRFRLRRALSVIAVDFRSCSLRSILHKALRVLIGRHASAGSHLHVHACFV
jgi:hypothetical protein